MKELLEAEARAPGTVLDHDFIRHHTTGFESVVAELEKSSWDEIVRRSGLSREQIGEAALHRPGGASHHRVLVHGPDPA